MQRALKVFLIESVAAVIITFLSLRSYLLGTGYYDYSDQSWSSATGVYPSGVFSTQIIVNGIASPFQFTRDVVTWPVLPITFVFSSPETAEKVFLLYTFLLFVAVAYVLSEFVVRLLEKWRGSIASLLRREGLKLVIVVFAFSNFLSMEFNVDGGTFSDGLILLFIPLSCVLLLCYDGRIGSILATAALLSLSLLLDPIYLPEFVIAIACTLIVSGLLQSQLANRVKSLGLTLGLTIPALGLVIGIIHATQVVGGPYYTYRTFSVQAVEASSLNASVLNAFMLLGYSWSTLAFAPPSVLSYGSGVSGLPAWGDPTQVLLPTGFVTSLWILSIILIPVVSFSSLLLKRVQRRVLPFAVLCLLGCVLSQYGKSQLALGIATAATNIPVIGSDIGTALALPERFLILVIAGYIVLFPISVHEVLLSNDSELGRLVRWLRGSNGSKPSQLQSGTALYRFFNELSVRSTGKGAGRPRDSVLHGGVAVFVVVLLLLSGWQAFGGSFYPSRDAGSVNPGNGVPNSGAFTPTQIPANTTQVFNLIHTTPGQFNIYWPNGGATPSQLQESEYPFHESDAPKPLAELPLVPSLVQNGLTSDLIAYLRENNVGFIVVQNESSELLAGDYGLTSFRAVNAVLSETSGLSCVFSASDIKAYKVNGDPGQLYDVPLLMTYDGISANVPAIYGTFEGLKTPVAVTSASAGWPNISVDNRSGKLQLLGASYFADSNPSFTANASLSDIPHHVTRPGSGYENFSNATGSLNFTQPSGQTSIDNWTSTNWGTSPVSVSWYEGVISWNSETWSPAVSLSYNGTLSGTPGGVEVLDPSRGPIQVSVSLRYQVSEGFSGGLNIFTYGYDSNWSSTGSVVDELSPATGWNDTRSTVVLGNGTRYFDFRVQATSFTGLLSVDDVNFSWGSTKIDISATQQENQLVVDGWTSTDWSAAPLATQFDEGNLTWTASTNVSAASFSFNGTLAAGYGGAQIPNPQNQTAFANLTFYYRTSKDFIGNLGVLVVTASQSGQALPGLYETLTQSATWKRDTITYVSGPGVASFTPRIQAQDFVGTVELSQVNLSWSILVRNGTTPFGLALSIPANGLRIPASPDTDWIQLAGTGDVNGIRFNETGRGFEWISVPATTGLDITGKAILAAVLVSPFSNLSQSGSVALVAAQIFYPDLVLIYSGQAHFGVSTVDGFAVFPGLNPDVTQVTVALESQDGLSWGYVVLVIWILGLLLVSMPYVRQWLRARLSRS